MRFLALTIVLLVAAGCASTVSSDAPLRVTVSAANYSQVPGDELFRMVHAPESGRPPPPIETPSRPIFYVFLAADYSKELPLDTIYSELATPLANRGYFNVRYQIKAGHPPNRIDYLLRIVCGRENWLTPLVRTDKVTWGNAGLVNTARSGNAYLLGSNSHWDPQVGMSPSEIAGVASSFQESQGGMGSMGAGTGSYSEMQSIGFHDLQSEAASRNYYLIGIEAFRFDDVRTKKGDAPCVWSVLVASPYRQGLTLARVLRPMARAATPYFGTTTNGAQVLEVKPMDAP